MKITGICSGIFLLASLTSVILFQWRVIIALLVMSSSRGQHSLNSSIVFLRSRKACHSFRARGSLRHLVVKGYNSQKAHSKYLTSKQVYNFCMKQSPIDVYVRWDTHAMAILATVSSPKQLIKLMTAFPPELSCLLQLLRRHIFPLRPLPAYKLVSHCQDNTKLEPH